MNDAVKGPTPSQIKAAVEAARMAGAKRVRVERDGAVFEMVLEESVDDSRANDNAGEQDAWKDAV